MGKPAARITDMHTCPMVTPGVPPIPHVGGPVIGPGVPTVLIGGMPAAVMGDMCVCVGPPDTIVLGSTGVMIGGKPAARMGDATAHGGVIMGGLPTVLIGEVGVGNVSLINSNTSNRSPSVVLESVAKPTLNAANLAGQIVGFADNTEFYNEMAKKLDVEPEVLKAVSLVESSGTGFNKDGTVKVRFEGHKFKDCLKKKGLLTKELIKDNPDLIYDYKESKGKPHGNSGYNDALKINDQCAKASTSFGATQIMGSNFKCAGYNSLDDFVTAQNTIKGQNESFFNFISNDPQKVNALQKKDFSAFARLFNGKDYKTNNYDVKMQENYLKLKKSNDTPSPPRGTDETLSSRFFIG